MKKPYLDPSGVGVPVQMDKQPLRVFSHHPLEGAGSYLLYILYVDYIIQFYRDF